MTASRENEFWPPEPIWSGEPAFVLASGPSLNADIVARLAGRHTIAVNSSCLLAPSASVLFFTDSSWYESHRSQVVFFRGLVICQSRTAKREFPDRVKRIQSHGDPDFLPDFSMRGTVQQGRSSGHTAIALAIALGAAKVYLLGFDMRLVDGREHCHSDYTGPRDIAVYQRSFLPGFRGWNDAAQAVGVSIINLTPGSAVQEFPFGDIDEVVPCDRS